MEFGQQPGVAEHVEEDEGARVEDRRFLLRSGRIPAWTSDRRTLTVRRLRACFAELRVVGILYALMDEKDLCHRSLRRRMGPLENPPSGLEAAG